MLREEPFDFRKRIGYVDRIFTLGLIIVSKLSSLINPRKMVMKYVEVIQEIGFSINTYFFPVISVPTVVKMGNLCNSTSDKAQDVGLSAKTSVGVLEG